jgi:thymidylate synthase
MYKNLKEPIKSLRQELFSYGLSIKTNNWQGVKNPPEFLEVLNVSFSAIMPSTIKEITEQCNPMLPWAEEHFEERVSGVPHNPPPSHAKWLKGNEEYMSGDKFSHTYPERMHIGLFQAVELLKKDPTTRQCYVPIWFPQDNKMSLNNERVPCTLGWHFILRNNVLNCYYPMRSCDALRHFHNDIYFAARLTLWVIEQAKLDAIPGILTFHAVSFHCFENDRYPLGKLIK